MIYSSSGKNEIVRITVKCTIFVTNTPEKAKLTATIRLENLDNPNSLANKYVKQEANKKIIANPIFSAIGIGKK